MISVIIPLYNKELSISKTISSVLAQSFHKYEIVVVNDGSTDKSLEVAGQFDDSRIRIINKTNGGVSSARNIGLKEAKYNFIAFLDADDFWNPDYLYEMRMLISDFPTAAIWGCNYALYLDGKLQHNNINLKPFFRNEVLNYFDIAKTNLLFWSSAVILDKKKAIELGGFDERISIGEDIDMWLRMILTNPPPIYFNKVLAYYNLDAQNRAMNRKHNYSSSFLFYIDKFNHWSNEKKEFRDFINQFLCLRFIDLFTSYKINKKIIKSFQKNIDKKYISIKWKIYCLLPFFLKKTLTHLYVKIRR